MMPQFGYKDDTIPPPEINTTPLIDVMLVLLIVLLITIPPATHSVKIDLPGDPGASQREVVTIDIDFDGTVLWNGNAVSGYEQLERFCKSIAMQSVQPDIRVRSDRRARYDVLAQVLAIAQRNGVSRIGLVGNERLVE